jgi:hypothetical protein
MSPSKRTPALVLVAALAVGTASGAAGCARAGQQSRRAPREVDSSAVLLVVRNDSFTDVDVWVMGYGGRARLGVVAADLTRNFVLDDWVAREPELRIVVAPFGRAGAPVTQSLVVRAGQTIDFTVGMQLWNSTVVVR